MYRITNVSCLKLSYRVYIVFNTTGRKFTKSKGHFHGKPKILFGRFATFHVGGIFVNNTAVHPG